ncbi:MAG: hypothetical protein SFV81_29110 [Pirellulaceae bacterium]|nr:hypothetical protein [Pirellulaceae bacterium]
MKLRLVQIERRSDSDESAWCGYIMFETESLMVLQYVSDSYNLFSWGDRVTRSKS